MERGEAQGRYRRKEGSYPLRLPRPRPEHQQRPGTHPEKREGRPFDPEGGCGCQEPEEPGLLHHEPLGIAAEHHGGAGIRNGDAVPAGGIPGKVAVAARESGDPAVRREFCRHSCPGQDRYQVPGIIPDLRQGPRGARQGRGGANPHASRSDDGQGDEGRQEE